MTLEQRQERLLREFGAACFEADFHAKRRESIRVELDVVSGLLQQERQARAATAAPTPPAE